MLIRILVFLCITSVGMAQSAAIKSLSGLKGVEVLIEDLSSDTKREGFTKGQLQTQVELRLRRSGIPIVQSDDAILYVNINTQDTGKGHANSASITLRQSVHLARDPSIFVPYIDLGTCINGICWRK